MKSFTEFLHEQESTGVYVSIDTDLEQMVEFKEGIFTKRAHCTLMYAEEQSFNEFKLKINSIVDYYAGKTIEGTCESIEAFDDKEGTCALVLKIDSEMIREIHGKLKALGLIHSYDDFQAHVTYAYRINKSDVDRLKLMLQQKFANKKFTFMNFTVEPLDKNWVT